MNTALCLKRTMTWMRLLKLGSVLPAKAGIQTNWGGEQTWIPACAGMTSRRQNHRLGSPSFSFPVGVRKIMNHFVVKFPSLLSL